MSSWRLWSRLLPRPTNYHNVVKIMAASLFVLGSKANENGLVLYSHGYSFYSQKVIMAMNEKKLKFEIAPVDITKGVQYEPWFLEINPRGEVPVLKDGIKIIPDSSRIIDYLEDNFSNGDTPKLMPTDKGPQVRQKIEHLRKIIDKLPANVITMGSFLHPEFAPDPKMPFIKPVRAHLSSADEKASDMLRGLADKYPEKKDVFLKKAEAHDHNRAKIVPKEGFQSLLNDVDIVLQEVEKELESHAGDDKMWLCTDSFTIADVALTILLDRLYLLGLESYFWTNGKKKNIELYYARVQQRESYKQTVPDLCYHLKTFVMSQLNTILGVVGASSAVVALCGSIKFWQRNK
ncbi:ganglioside-induced differentiation-associated protein 1 [Nilaparvata lugens]|uniref:ganglioside-induced differentiation-associated protein 1 n=1 Tax=Nilaparvata lugens TaxID=108931 RepID=UPI000B9967BC|nr:ganglioside-induced differentiation-associated protein 1 [Nilaparvata lugens]